MPGYNPLSLAGKHVLVTGASSGIGRSIAIVASRLGARLTLTGRREDALEETRRSAERPDEHAIAPFDLTRLDEIPGWLQGLVKEGGTPFDGVAHAAGVSAPTPIRVLSRKRIDDIVVPNLHSTLMLLRGATARGVGADGGAFVVISSAAAFTGAKGLGVYAASKGALHSVVRAAAQELADRRIRVNCVVPGYVETEMYAQVSDALPGGPSHAQRQFLGLISAEEVAVAAGYLLSDAARHVTGSALTIDGGMSL